MKVDSEGGSQVYARKMKIRLFPRVALVAVSILLLSEFCEPRAVAGLSSDSVTLDTIKGQSVIPLKSDNGKPAVVVFITTDCPIANALAPEINRIFDDYHKRGIKFTLVHVDPELSTADARKHAKDYALKPPIVIDRKHQLVKSANASVTPQAAVFDGEGKLVYSGRLNNQWMDYGKRRAVATEHNLRDTLEALLAGKPVGKSRSSAVGCYIPD